MSLYGVEGSVLIRRRQRLGLCHPWALTGIAQGGMNSTWHGYQHTRGGRVKAEKKRNLPWKTEAALSLPPRW